MLYPATDPTETAERNFRKIHFMRALVFVLLSFIFISSKAKISII